MLDELRGRMRTNLRRPSQTPKKRLIAQWITRLRRTDFLASPVLAIQMAEEIRGGRWLLSETPPPRLRPIGEHWIDRFGIRHPEIRGIWTRQIENARHKATIVNTTKT